MFRDLLNNPIDPIPIDYINTLSRPTKEVDMTLTHIGIAMLRPRIENYTGITGCYQTLSEESACVNDFLTNQYPKLDNAPMLCYYVYRNKNADGASEKLLKESGFELKENISTLMATKGNVKCIAAYHPVKNCAALFVNSNDIRFYHMLISFVSLLWPSLFKDKPLTEQDYNIVKALGKTDKNTFIQQIQTSIAPYIVEFRKMMLATLLKNIHQTKIESAKHDVAGQRQYVEKVANDYDEAMKRLKTLIVTYEGLKATESFDEVEEDLIEYLSTKKELHNLSVVGQEITFSVATLLNNYNADAWRIFSERGSIYDGEYGPEANPSNIQLLDVFKDKTNRKIFLDNVFSESPDFAIKIAGNYRLDLYGCNVRSERGYNYIAADPVYTSYIPNPHLKIFSCLGGYETRINRALRDRNYVAAVELCCTSAGSVDLDETAQTFRPFLGWVLTSREKIMHRRDGVDMTPEEALIWLIDKEKKNETN